MLPPRLLRTSTSHPLKKYLTNSFNYNHRTLCIPQPLPKHPPAPPPNLHTKPSEKPSPQPQDSEANKKSIPDVPSTSWSSIGFEEQDAKDPNKWKKFAWKYAGAVLLFMISYKTLHWYTDRLEADGKRRRKEMEEDREIAQQILSSDTSSTQSFPFLEPLKDTPKLPETTSELDELYIYKTELQQELQTLRSQPRTSETRTQINDTQAQLKDLADDIKLLEAKKPAS